MSQIRINLTDLSCPNKSFLILDINKHKNPSLFHHNPKRQNILFQDTKMMEYDQNLWNKITTIAKQNWYTFDCKWFVKNNNPRKIYENDVLA